MATGMARVAVGSLIQRDAVPCGAASDPPRRAGRCRGRVEGRRGRRGARSGGPDVEVASGRAGSAAGEAARGGVAVSRDAAGLERRSEIGVSAALCALVGAGAAAGGGVRDGTVASRGGERYARRGRRHGGRARPPSA